MDATPESLQSRVLQVEAIFLCNQTTAATLLCIVLQQIWHISSWLQELWIFQQQLAPTRHKLPDLDSRLLSQDQDELQACEPVR